MNSAILKKIKTMSAQCRHIARMSAWYLTVWAQQWHTVNSCLGEHLHYSWRFY